MIVAIIQSQCFIIIKSVQTFLVDKRKTSQKIIFAKTKGKKPNSTVLDNIVIFFVDFVFIC